MDEEDQHSSDDDDSNSGLEIIFDSNAENGHNFLNKVESHSVQAEIDDQQDDSPPSLNKSVATKATLWNRSQYLSGASRTMEVTADKSSIDEDEKISEQSLSRKQPALGDDVFDLSNLSDIDDELEPFSISSPRESYDASFQPRLSTATVYNSNPNNGHSSYGFHHTGWSTTSGSVAPESTQHPNHDRLSLEPMDFDDQSSASKKRKWDHKISRAPVPSDRWSSAQASAQSRAQHMPGWMKYDTKATLSVRQPQQLGARVTTLPPTISSSTVSYRQLPGMLIPTSVPMKRGFIPIWERLLPLEFLQSRKVHAEMSTERKRYVLSVLNVNEFTIAGAPDWNGSRTTSIRGLRAQIRQLSHEYGKAVFERDSDADEGGKWRIPLGAYQAIFSYLTSLANTTVEGIPHSHLNIAMLGRQRLEKGCPSVQKMIHIGVPKRLANTLAPFQRGGVDFVHERRGRALIADEMGLGKTIQAIASIAIYHEDWPVLILTPSGARYHWQNEFLNWLGPETTEQTLLDFGNEGEADAQFDEVLPGPKKMAMQPLIESQINVLTSGASPMIPTSDTKVVIISYGLAPKMVEEGKLLPGMFKCAIVDESHMLKNKNSKRTKGLMPLLSATSRCILLSGTPAFARPIELWPQMTILGSAEDPSMTNEAEFVRKYVKSRNKNRLAELHTVLTGTIMIRRMKNDILKQLPAKVREQGIVNILDEQTREEFQLFLEQLREGKGALAGLARSHQGSIANNEIIPREPSLDHSLPKYDPTNNNQSEMHRENGQSMEGLNPHYIDRMGFCQRGSSNIAAADVPVSYTKSPFNGLKGDPRKPTSKKALLIQMYMRTGQVKIPLIAEMLKIWLNDPSKGKLCIFAHHISVLNEIVDIAGLSNDAGSAKSFIRIDGSTNPRQRQDQINAFQKDPTIRVAMLGITAAGVAVTLTAASTVWFAELFWTPALLIQAEDRCHRIGQQAKCRCLYIVAKGTLDEILWQHIEKKFRDLGEFVEGKEKMKLVVHKTYRGALELKKSLEVDKIDFDVEEEFEDAQIDEAAEALESELHQAIEELERDEQEMLKVDLLDDDDADGDMDAKGSFGNTTTGAGSTETEAICLIDDEEDDVAPPVRKSLEDEGIKSDREFPDLKLYEMKFPGPSCGLEITQCKGRVVVSGKADFFSKLDKPCVGDILLAVNNREILPNLNLHALLKYLEIRIKNDGQIEILFAEDEEFRNYFTTRLQFENRHTDGSMQLESPRPFELCAKIQCLPTYKVEFDGMEDYGFQLESIESIIFVSSLSSSRIHYRGANSIPSVGDVLLAINDASIKPGVTVASVTTVLNALKEQGMACEMTFAAADESIVEMVLDQCATSCKTSGALVQSRGSWPSENGAPPPQVGGCEVIDLLND